MGKNFPIETRNGGVGDAYAPPTPPEFLVLRDCSPTNNRMPMRIYPNAVRFLDSSSPGPGAAKRYSQVAR